MVGKWYKFIWGSTTNFTHNKYYLCTEFNEKYSKFNSDNGEIVGSDTEMYFDLSNPMDHNPDEVKEEVKEEHNFRVETITIVIFNDGKYQTNTTLSPKELVKHLKEATYRLDKQINEE